MLYSPTENTITGRRAVVHLAAFSLSAKYEWSNGLALGGRLGASEIFISEGDATGEEREFGMLYALSFPDLSLRNRHWRVSLSPDWSIAKTDFNAKQYRTRHSVGLTVSVHYEF